MMQCSVKDRGIAHYSGTPFYAQWLFDPCLPCILVGANAAASVQNCRRWLDELAMATP